jgi:hypothetical protein
MKLNSFGRALKVLCFIFLIVEKAPLVAEISRIAILMTQKIFPCLCVWGHGKLRENQYDLLDALHSVHFCGVRAGHCTGCGLTRPDPGPYRTRMAERCGTGNELSSPKRCGTFSPKFCTAFETEPGPKIFWHPVQSGFRVEENFNIRVWYGPYGYDTQVTQHITLI